MIVCVAAYHARHNFNRWVVALISQARWGVSHLALLWALAAVAPAHAAESVLYSFAGGADGAAPIGEVIGLKRAGVLYGVTAQGGDLSACGGAGCGVVYELEPPAAGGGAWTEKVLYEFKGGADGAVPAAGLLLDKTGALYGTTSQGGGRGQCHSYSGSDEGALVGCGTVFKLTPPAAGGSVWSETVLHRFNGKDGRLPDARLLIDKTGALYGVTRLGGAPRQGGNCGYVLTTINSAYYYNYTTGCGTAFRVTPPAAGGTVWTETVLHVFKGDTNLLTRDGARPEAGLIEDRGGTLFGTTYQDGGNYGGGTVFSLTPPAAGSTIWKEAILDNFPMWSAGMAPDAQLYANRSGVLFGTTFLGGVTEFGFGTAFALSPPAAGKTRWGHATLHEFAGGQDGANPLAGLTHDPTTGRLYGVTSAGGGGGGCSCGTVFALLPPAAGETLWREIVVHRFGRGRDGSKPAGKMIEDKAGNLYGTTESGGDSGHGTVFKITP